MNILVVEDRGSVAYYMTDNLKKMGHKVFNAFSITDAQSIWVDSEIQIDSIIIDLNMNPPNTFFSEKEMEQTKLGKLTGWIWLYNHVLKDVKNTDETIRNRIIIYSDYLNELKASVPEKDLKNITLIPKRGSTSTAEQLLTQIRIMSNSLKSI